MRLNPQDVDVRALLPQQPPMLLVDRLLSADERSATTALLVSQDNIFVSDGRLNAYALIEVMAQTCAAQIGYMDKGVSEYNSLRIGYIGAVKKMQVESAPRVGDTLITRVEILEEVMDMKLVAAESFVGDKRIAVAEMKVALSGERIQG